MDIDLSQYSRYENEPDLKVAKKKFFGQEVAKK